MNSRTGKSHYIQAAAESLVGNIMECKHLEGCTRPVTLDEYMNNCADHTGTDCTAIFNYPTTPSRWKSYLDLLIKDEPRPRVVAE